MNASSVRSKTTEQGRAAVVIAIVLLAALILAGVALLFWKDKAGSSDFLRTAARMAPESTQLFFVVEGTQLDFAESAQKEALSALGQSESFKEAKKKLQDTLGLRLDEDILALIKPNASLALAPRAGQSSIIDDVALAPRDAPPFRLFLLLALKDDRKADKVMETIQGKAKTPYTTEIHAGATLHVPETPGKGPAWAIDRSLLIIGLSGEDLKAALDGVNKNARSLADNPSYARAVKTLKRREAMIAYADLQGIVKSERLRKIQQKEVRDLMGALRTAVAGAAIEGGDLVSEFKLKIDSEAAGVLGADILKPEYGIDMKSVEFVPADTEMFLAVNAKMVWQMTYDIMGRFPQGRMMREFPAAQLQQKGIDFQSDVMDALAGDLALSVPDYSKVVAMQFGGMGEKKNPRQSIDAMQQMRMSVILPFAEKAKLDALLAKPFLQPLAQVFIVEDHAGVKIHNMVGQFAYAVQNDALLLGINKADEGIREIVDAVSRKEVMKTHSGFAKTGSLLGDSRPVFLSYMDMEKVYGAAAREIESKDPGTARLLLLLSKMGCAWQAWTIRADGLHGVGLQTDMKL